VKTFRDQFQYLIIDRDLLARHMCRRSHHLTSQVEAVTTATPTNGVEIGETDAAQFWDLGFMAQDMLPASLFDIDFHDFEAPTSVEPLQKSTFAQFSSRLPTLDDVEDDAENDSGMCDREDGLAGDVLEPWVLSNTCYESFLLEIQQFSAVLPEGCSIPAQSSLIRCLEKYLRCAQEFLPFIHCATFRGEQKPAELLVAMAAVGSRYLFEQSQSYELYFIAKAILSERIQREGLQSTSDFMLRQHISPSSRMNELGRLQTFILLIEFASWADERILRDAFFMASQLAVLIKENGISDSDETGQDMQWLTWVAVEERRRTLFAAYMLSNLHSIAFDVPPLILNYEIGLCLPCYAAQWRSISSVQWDQVDRQPEQGFQVGLQNLFSAVDSPGTLKRSSFANYLLIQGIIQEMSNECHKSMTMPNSDNIKSFEAALRRWQSCWEMTDESSHDSNLDPMYAKGPFALTGAALLRLAYIRLSSGHNPSKKLLLSRNPQCMLQKQSSLQRSQQVNRAVIHAAHSLSIPARLGITFMTTTKTGIWSLEQSICSLESAILLADWLNMISATVRSLSIDAVQKVEKRLLGIIKDIIKGTSFAGTLDMLEDYASQIQRMACTVIKIWAAIFQGVNVLHIENVIGAGLQLLADLNPN
jgi:hypothetical protein